MRTQHLLAALAGRSVTAAQVLTSVFLLTLILTSASAQRDQEQAALGVLGATQERTCGPGGVAVAAPGTNLRSLVQNSSPGACFTLGAGTYRFSDVVPKDDMTFIGAGSDVVIVDGRGHENAFHGTADNVTIAGMTFQNFDSSGGTKRQEQSPIRGTRALWASFRGTMATNWTIDSIVSRDNYASGIFLGDHFTVVNSVFSGNGTTGIAGNEIEGGLIENNVVFRNGVQQAGGALVNGGGIKVTQAGTPEDPLVVRANEFYENVDIAVWCDISCRGFHAIDNYIHDHRSSGVVIELSTNALIEGNRIENSSTWSDFGIDFNAGAITIAESSHSIVRNNYISGARGGVIVRQTKRPFLPGEFFLPKFKLVNYVTSDVLVENNVMINTEMMGFGVGRTGAGIVPNPASIRFVSNRYGDPSAMRFHHDGRDYDYSSWLASGRDGGASTGPLPSADRYGPERGSVVGPTPTPAPTPAPSQPEDQSQPSGTAPLTVPLRINAGGGQVTDENGVVWLEDTYFVAGSTAVHAQGRDIELTATDDLYRNERWGASGYRIPVENGTYQVITHHGEVFDGCQKPSCRVFDILVEGQPMAENLDIFAEVGGFTAMQLEQTVTVDDGYLDVSFVSEKQSPQISAIEVLPTTQLRAQNDAAADESSAEQTPGGRASPSTAGPSGAGGAGTTGDQTASVPDDGNSELLPGDSGVGTDPDRDGSNDGRVPLAAESLDERATPPVQDQTAEGGADIAGGEFGGVGTSTNGGGAGPSSIEVLVLLTLAALVGWFAVRSARRGPKFSPQGVEPNETTVFLDQ